MNAPLRLLLLDDNADDRMLALRELERSFPELAARLVLDADGFRRALEGETFDVVVTDYQLRWTDGLSVLRAVKERDPDCPVIMFTATGTQEIAVEGMKTGLDDYVIKAPAHFIRLPLAVRAGLERAAQRRALRHAEAHRRELAAELRRRVEELAAADRQKNEFLAMLSHELRNPLAPILTAVEIQRLSGVTHPMLERAQAVIERQVRHLARLVDELLDLSRITHGRIELRKEKVDLRRVIDDALETSRPLIEAKQHQLSIDLPAGPLLLHADSTRLTQVVTNLLNNAALYTDPGGQIALVATPEKDYVTLRSRDSGRGIAPEFLPHVFDLFTQGQRSLDRAEGGLGIGLTLVRRLVELHGGTVEAHSPGRGAGSEFVVRLPLLGQEGIEANLPEDRNTEESEGTI